MRAMEPPAQPPRYHTFCPQCGTKASGGAPFCGRCGSSLASEESAEARASRTESDAGGWAPPKSESAADPTVAGAWLIIAGAVLAGIGTVLPWGTASTGFVTFTRNGFQLGDNGTLTADGPVVLGLAVVTLIIGITRLTGTSVPSPLQRSSIVTGVVMGLVLGAEYSSIHDWATNLNSNQFVRAAVSYGFWLCGAGALAAVVGGVILRTSPKGVAEAQQKAAIAGKAVTVETDVSQPALLEAVASVASQFGRLRVDRANGVATIKTRFGVPPVTLTVVTYAQPTGSQAFITGSGAGLSAFGSTEQIDRLRASLAEQLSSVLSQ